MKRFYRTLFLQLIIAIIIFCGLYWVTATEKGLVFLAHQIERYTHGTLRIAEVQGTLITRVNLKGVSYNLDDIDIKAKSTQITINLTQGLAIKSQDISVSNHDLIHANIRSLNFSGWPSKFSISTHVKELRNDDIRINDSKISCLINRSNIQQLGRKRPRLFPQSYRGARSQSALATQGEHSHTPLEKPHARLSRGQTPEISFVKDNDIKLHISEFQYKTLSAKNVNIKTEQLKNTELKITILPFDINYLINGKNRKITIGQSSIRTKQVGNDFIINTTLNSPQIQKAQATLKLKNYQFARPISSNTAIQGNLIFSSKIPEYLGIAEQYISETKGDIYANLSVYGQLDALRLKGQVRVKNASLFLKPSEIKIKNISAIGTFEGRKFHYNGQLKTNTAAHFEGRGEILSNGYMTNTHIQGKNILVSDTKSIRLYSSPDIAITATNKKLSVTGTIIIPKGKIFSPNFNKVVNMPDETTYVQQLGGKRPRLFPQFYRGARSQSALATQGEHSHTPLENPHALLPRGQAPEIPFIEKKKDKTTTHLDYYNRITLILKKDIKIQYRGLKGQLTGKLLLIDTPTQPLSGLGNIYIINGTYPLQNQDIKIEKGHLAFRGGPLTNPHLDIVASRTVKPNSTTNLLKTQAEQFVVGIKATGSLRAPQISLFSRPGGLSQADILSYLLFGHAVSTYNQNKTQLLYDAATNINFGNGKGIGSVTQSVRDTLNLNELGISQDDLGNGSQHTVAAFGKYISPLIYVRYSIGVLDAISHLQVRYKLSKRIQLQADTSTLGSGLDVLYVKESN